MRVDVELSVVPGTVIPMDHQYLLASWIYRTFERVDGEWSSRLHGSGRYKLYTFSQLMIPGRRFRVRGDRMEVLGDMAHLQFSTAREDVFVNFVRGVLEAGEVVVGRARLPVLQVYVVREPERIGRRERFYTLSPVIVSYTAGGREVWLTPEDEGFVELVSRNLENKYRALYGRDPDGCVERITPLREPKRKLKRVGNAMHRCVEMYFEVEGDEELIRLGYQVGFGRRNSMGFGMVKRVVDRAGRKSL
ncbi:CRISPR-associated endoribonuclease Cas6 [Archaeoglobus neptunius]|uniref:CRISPR-associated endoribonuclease Cas6 n=1 Tax=Archaeoglobus neptunius TaxID=2798580 RepID=UPI001925ABFA|nr:CRISPR-associated endoribonuclease Cas6 [Archaeoglobus neptunius]